MDLTLVIMAAGMGQRFGGIKQIEPIGPNGEIMLDYSVFDAKKAGINKVVFVIKRDIELQFKEKIFDRISRHIDCSYVFQDIDDLPKGFFSPPTRQKPWGTAHAAYCARNEVKTPFVLINADDFYGAGAFKLIADFLNSLDADEKYNYCMAGYELKNTLSEEGYVSRGICRTDSGGNLIDISEKTHIEKNNDVIEYKENGETKTLAPDTVVSINCWGFTKEFFNEIEDRFPRFYNDNINNLEKAEYFMPSVVADLLREGKAKVKVLKCGEKWYGFTYRKDKETVVKAVKDMVAEGKYPPRLWE